MSTLDVAATVSRGDFTLDVQFAAAPGEVLAVLGPNGAGKSTLLTTLAGHLPLTSGRISLGDRVLDDASSGEFVEPADRSIGFVYQDYRLFPHVRVLDNVGFASRARGMSRTDSRALAAQWLARLGVADLASRRPAELSGGQAQRVALARALAGEPEMLLLDEPLAALDARTRLEVQAHLRDHLSQFGGPCLLITHDPLEALVLADRLVVIEGGRIVQEGSPADITRRPATDYVARLVGLNLYQGRSDGRVVSLVQGGELVVPSGTDSGDVLVALRPSAVVVHPSRPDASSARNVWPARVTGMSLLADRVRLDLVGSPSVLVDVTPAAVGELGIATGSEVWVSAKATEVEVYARPA